MPRQHLRLQVGHKPERHFLFQEGMDAFFPLALLPGGQDQFAGVVAHHHRAAVARLEIPGSQLPAVDERQRQPVGKDRAQFLDQIEREARPPRPVAMQKAGRWVEADAFQLPLRNRLARTPDERLVRARAL